MAEIHCRKEIRILKETRRKRNERHAADARQVVEYWLQACVDEVGPPVPSLSTAETRLLLNQIQVEIDIAEARVERNWVKSLVTELEEKSDERK